MGNKNQILYIVRATVPNEKIAAGFVEWIRGGHMQEVCKYADRGSLNRVDTQGEFIQFDCLYYFKDRAMYEKYVREAAPALRAEGMKKFGSNPGFRFERWSSQQLLEIGTVRSMNRT